MFRQNLYLHNLNEEEIRDISNKPAKEITIEIKGNTGFTASQLEALNQILANDEYYVSLDYSIRDIEYNKDLIYNTEIIKHLSNLKHLGLFNHEYEEPISNFDFVEHTPNLASLRTLGLFKKSISLEPLLSLKSLTNISFCFDLNKKQQQIANELLPNIERFSSPSFDLTDTPICTQLKEFQIEKKLTASELLPVKFPNLVSLFLKKQKNIEDFSFLSEMKNLKKLILHWIFQLKKIPDFSKLTELEVLEIIGSPNIEEGVENIFSLKKLRGLALTEIQYPKASSFEGLVDIKSLKSVYIYYRKNSIEDKVINQLVEKYNWISKTPGLAGIQIII